MICPCSPRESKRFGNSQRIPFLDGNHKLKWNKDLLLYSHYSLIFMNSYLREKNINSLASEKEINYFFLHGCRPRLGMWE